MQVPSLALGRLRPPGQSALIFAVFVIAVTLAAGVWIGQQVEAGIVRQTGEVTALYVDSALGPYLQDARPGGALSAEHKAAVDRILRQTPLGRDVVVFKLWDADGRVLYSSNPALVGREFPISHGEAQAWRGTVSASISDLQEEENVDERAIAPSLLEIYSPVRRQSGGDVIAVAELYQPAGQIERQALATKEQTWLLVLAASLLVYVMLMVLPQGRHAAKTSGPADAGQDTLGAPIGLHLGDDLETTAGIRRAATRPILLSESLLRHVSDRINSEPIQDIGLALLLLDTVSALAHEPHPSGADDRGDLTVIQTAVVRSLAAVRGLIADLSLPDLERMTVGESAAHAVRAHEEWSGSSVSLAVDDRIGQAPLPVKIVLYRFIQESLATWKRLGQSRLLVIVTPREGSLFVQTVDSGAAGEAAGTQTGQSPALWTLRARVESIGGGLRVEWRYDRLWRIIAELPLTLDD